MSDRSPNKYNPDNIETQAAIERVDKAVQHAINQKVGRLAQICVALVHKLGDIDTTVTEEELNGAAGWSMAIEKLDNAVKIKTEPPPEELEKLAEQPPTGEDSFLL